MEEGEVKREALQVEEKGDHVTTQTLCVRMYFYNPSDTIAGKEGQPEVREKKTT